MANNADILGEEAAVRQIVENDFSATNGHFEDDGVTVLRETAFYNKTGLTSAYFPNVTTMRGNRIFESCTNLTSLSMPNLQYINEAYCFRYINAPLSFTNLINTVDNDVFNNYKGKYIDIGGRMSRIGYRYFKSCSNLVTIIIRKTSAVMVLWGTNAFDDTKYATNGAGGAYVYVPRDLISTYQAATNWATLYAAHSDMFRALEDYTVDGTTTGDFDESKL